MIQTEIFKPVSLEDRATITSYTLRGQSNICDLAFSNLYGWAERYGTSWAIIEGGLVIAFQPKHRPHPAYLMPICDHSEGFVSTISRLRELAQEGGYPLVLMGVGPLCREHLEAHCPQAFVYLSDEGSYDYVYLRERLATLGGKSLQSKRNHINKFEKLYPDYTYEPITPAIVPECLSLLDVWYQAHEGDESQEAERTMIERTMRHWDAIGLSGGAIRVGGEIVAFTFGSPINATTFGVHVEKADIRYEGAFNIINREFARRIPEQYIYINREEDLGLEGLRKSKMSYKPEILLHKDTAILRHPECSNS